MNEKPKSQTAASECMDPQRAIALQNHSRELGDLLIWTIYRSPSDFPGKTVVRPHSARRNAPLLHHMEAESVEALRAMLPPLLYRIGRAPSDDPVIVETWA